MIEKVTYKLQGEGTANEFDSWVITYTDNRLPDIIYDFPPLIERLYLEDFIDILNIDSFKNEGDYNDFVVKNKRDIKLENLESNYIEKCKTFVYNNNSYSIEPINLIDLNGLITLSQDSNIGVINSNGEYELKMHTLDELILLFDAIRVHLTTVKTNRFLKRSELLNLTLESEIDAFDISLTEVVSE